MRVAAVRVEDFRALRDVYLSLDNMTVLVGENNSGKTSLLDAVAVAFGERVASVVDLHIDHAKVPAKKCVIDVRLEPWEGEDFDESAREIFADAIQVPLKGSEFVALRYSGAAESGNDRLIYRRKFVKGWADGRAAAAALDELKAPAFRSDMSDGLFVKVLDARRDVAEQLRHRSSVWNELVGKLDLPDALRQTVENDLETLGKTVLNGSPVLKSLVGELNHVSQALTRIAAGVTVAALPASADELGRAMDILLEAPGSSPISILRLSCFVPSSDPSFAARRPRCSRYQRLRSPRHISIRRLSALYLRSSATSQDRS